MADTFNVIASFDKSSYNQGDTITLTISGDDVLTTTTTTSEAVSGTINLTAADGSTSTLTFPAGVTVNLTSTTSTPESVVMSKIVDSAGRTWNIAATGLTATATA